MGDRYKCIYCTRHALRGSEICSQHNPRLWGVYSITHIESGKMYIGKSWEKNGIAARNDSECRASNNDGMYLTNAIRKYGWKNFKFEILYVAEKNDPAVFDKINQKEIDFIREFDTLSPRGYNLEGGGGTNKLVSEETKEKQRLAKLGKPGKSNSNAINAMHEANRGRVQSAEERQKRSRSAKNKKIKSVITDDMLSKATESKKKPVYQYDLSGKFIKQFNSLKEASEESGDSRESIGHCCNGRTKRTRKYTWRFVT